MSVFDKLAARARKPGQLRVTIRASELLNLIAVVDAAKKQIDACTFCGGTGVFEIGAVARMQSACPTCKDLRRAVDKP